MELNYDRIYYLLTGRQSISWLEAEKLCMSFGGHLPSITSNRDMALLLKFLLGPVQEKLDYIYVPESDCRYWDPLCMVFIGLNISKVQCTALSIGYIHQYL